MCLIIAKPAGVSMPTTKTIENAWYNNYDGFGLAYALPDEPVTILKGAMTQTARDLLIKQIPKPIESNIIMHFRFATQGAIIPEACHPYPVSSSIRKLASLNMTCPIALAHNGIILDTSAKSSFTIKGVKSENVSFKEDWWLSDTQLFIREYVAPLGKTIFHKGVKKLLYAYAGNSKFAFITPDGIFLLGEFVKDRGIYYSNDGYKTRYTYYYSWYDDDKKDDDIYSKGDTHLPKYKDGCYECEYCLVMTRNISYYQGAWLCPQCLAAWEEDSKHWGNV